MAHPNSVSRLLTICARNALGARSISIIRRINRNIRKMPKDTADH